ncbi:MAG: ribulose-phosphate 3-epimerase [Clostridiaceae bacterium]|nr:ribulose-phosphate 3-epimerase [Clostridiaceae bacterium]
MVIIAPSLLSANAGNYDKDIKVIEEGGAKYLHIDVMDGHFVPNMSFGPNIVQGIRENSNLFFDVHLMIEKPEQFVIPFIEAGADSVTIHVEASDKIKDFINTCKQHGVKAGVSLRPQTPVSSIEGFISDLDLLLIMSINPGFGGQSFMPESLERISEAKLLREKHKANFLISVDGGVNAENAGKIRQAGADILVAGSAIFGKEDRKAAIQDIINSAEQRA